MPTIVTVFASNVGLRDAQYNQQRLQLAVEIAVASQALGANLVVLPAGYMFAANEPDARALAMQLGEVFFQVDAAVIGGIDIHWDGPLNRARIESGALPFFVFAAEAQQALVYWERQRSFTADNARFVPAHDLQRSSVAHVAGMDVGILACGELFNEGIRDALVQEAPALIANPAHFAMVRGVNVRYRELAQATGTWVLNAQHYAAGNPHPAKWCFDPAGNSHTTAMADYLAGTRQASSSAFGLWAELKAWTV